MIFLIILSIAYRLNKENINIISVVQNQCIIISSNTLYNFILKIKLHYLTKRNKDRETIISECNEMNKNENDFIIHESNSFIYLFLLSNELIFLTKLYSAWISLKFTTTFILPSSSLEISVTENSLSIYSLLISSIISSSDSRR